MQSKQYVWVATLMLAGLTGCAMCDNGQDSSYAAFGGKWQRDNPYSGRVGSAFDPAGMRVIDSSLPTQAEPPMEIVDEEGEVVEPLLDEMEIEGEAAEAETLDMSEAEDEAEEQAEEQAEQDAEDTAPDATAEDDRESASGAPELPDMPLDSLPSEPRKRDTDLLPPLEFAP
jgi:hypothetical protein